MSHHSKNLLYITAYNDFSFPKKDVCGKPWGRTFSPDYWQEGKYFCCMFLHNSFLSHSNIVPKRSTNVHLCTQCAKLGYLAGDKYTVNRQVLISRELHCMFMLEVRVRRLNLYVWTWTNVKHTDWFKEERCPLQDFPRFPFICICIEITWHFICVCLIDRSSYEAASLFIWSSIASC